jgi:hypothetical protein
MQTLMRLLIGIILLSFFCSCSFNSEAENKAIEKWSSVLTKCDGNTYLIFSDYNSVYNYQEVQVIQLNDYVIETKVGRISEADKLNGIEWVGKSQLKAKASRICYFRNGRLNEKWSNWNNWNTSESFSLTKENGRWKIGPFEREEYIYREGRYIYKECNELKKLITQAL